MEDHFSQDIGKKVLAWRKSLGIKQADLEIRAGLAHNAISRIERGEVASPRQETLEKLAQAMEISVEELLFRPPPVEVTEESDLEIKALLEEFDQLPVRKKVELLTVFRSLINLVKDET